MVKYFFLAFYILIISIVSARAQSPWYFGTGEAVNLTNGTAYKNGVKTIAGSLNPSSTAVSAPAGSMYYSTSGTIYVKQDAGLSTNWLPLGIATTGSLTTINGQSGPNVSIASSTSGSDFAVSAASNTITLNLPTASAIARGALSSSDWSLFNSKEPAIAATTSADYYRGDKTFQPLNKAAVGLSNVDNTSDAAKPISTATQAALNLKEDSTAAGTTSQYWRGDKSWQTLDKAAVGLGNVDNTSDANKPVSTATQTALNLKVDGASSSVDSELMLYSGTTGKVSKRASGTGYVKVVSGVFSASSTVATTELTGQVALANGGTNKSLTPVNGGVVYTDADSQEVSAAGTSGQVLQSNGAAAPTFVNKSISGKAEGSSSVTVDELQVPNYQLTPTATNKYLINNCGSPNNILANCGFENINPGTSYTLSPAVPLLETSDVPEGKQSLSFSPTAQPFQVTQDSTLHATAFADGVQGLAMARVKVPTTVTENIVMCPTLAGVLTTTCVSVPKTGKWVLVKVPFILGGTSNGLSIHNEGFTNMTATGIKVDDLFVGAVDLKQDINVVGPKTDYTPVITHSSGAITNHTIVADWQQVGTMMKLTGKISFSAAPGTFSGITISLPSGYTIDTAKLKNLNQTGSTMSLDFGSRLYPGGGVECLTTTTCSVYASTTDTFTGNSPLKNINYSNLYPFTFGASDSIQWSIEVPVTQFSGASSVYTASNADTDWASCGYTTSDFTGFGTVTGIDIDCKKQGSDLLLRGRFTAGTPTAVEARLALKFNSTALTSKSTPATYLAGDAIVNASSATYFRTAVLIEPSTSYVTFSIQSSTGNAYTKVLGTSFASSQIVSIDARIPISGWTGSNVIIGTFNEVPTTRGSNGVDFQSVLFGSGTLCGSPCTTGTCLICRQAGGKITSVTWAATGQYNLNGIDGTKYACTGTGYTTVAPTGYTNILHDLAASTTSAARVQTGIAATGYNSGGNTVICVGTP